MRTYRLAESRQRNNNGIVLPVRIIKINYSIGDKVKKGDCVAIIEAMKMENEVISNISGEVKEIYVEINSQISNDKPIMLIQ